MRNRTLFASGVAALALACTASAGGTPTASPTQKLTLSPACNVEAYVVDPDPKGLNVRDAPGVGGRVVAVIPSDVDGTVVHLAASSANGWVQIDRAETIGGTVVFENKKGWVSGNMLATETRGYGTRGVRLYAAARKGSAVGTVPPENEVRVAGCSGDWIKVRYKNLNGWLQPEDQCPNPVTTCN
jgi:SH3-like domain-containing protein